MQGKKTGGRKPGSRNKKTVEKKAIKALFELVGNTPLEVIIEVMRNPKAPPELRFEAAKAAAPYAHPKLASMKHEGVLTTKLDVTDLAKLPDAELAALEGVVRKLADARSDPGGSGPPSEGADGAEPGAEPD